MRERVAGARRRRRVSPRMSALSRACLVATVCGACDAVTENPSPVSVRDSAGIRLVENRGDITASPIVAELGPPDLTIGVVEGPAEYSLGQVSDSRSLSDGGVVIADLHTLSLSIFGHDGVHRVTAGGRGGGPGEFRFIAIAGVDEDGVWAWDPMSQRSTHFSHAGDLVEAVTFDRRDGDPFGEVHRLLDGTYVARSRYSGSGSGDLEVTPLKLVTDSLILRHLDRSGRELDTIAVTAAEEQLREVWDADDGSRQGVGAMRPFGATTFWVPHADGGATTLRSTAIEFVRRDGAGQVVMIARVPGPQRPLDPDEVERLEQDQLEAVEDNPRYRVVVHRAFEESSLPQVAPLVSAMKIDAKGNYWIAEFATFPDEVSEWVVFAETGRLLGRVVFPQGLVVHEIGSDWVLGVVQDDLGVQYVQRYPLLWLQ